MLHVLAGANNFNAIQSSVGTTRPAAAQGAAVTPAVGSKGSWAQCIASLDHDTFGLLININSNTARGASRNSVVDVGVGPSGQEIVLIPDLIAGNAATYISGGSGLWYYFPVAIPAGTRIAVRAQGSVTTAFRVFVQAMQKPMNPSLIKKASYVDVIGMTAPQGTALTPGTTSKSSWTLLGTTSRRCWFWQIGAQVSSADIAHGGAVTHIDIAEGDGTDFNILVQDAALTTATNEVSTLSPVTVGCEVPVPEGTDVYVRAQSSGGGDPLFVAAYGAGG